MKVIFIFADKMTWIFAILLTSAAVIVHGNHEVKSCTVNVTDDSIDEHLLSSLTDNSVLCFANHSKWYEIIEFFIVADLDNIIIQGPSHITCKKGVGLVFITFLIYTFTMLPSSNVD